MALETIGIKAREKYALFHYALMLAEDAKIIRWPWFVCAAWALLYWQCWLGSPWIAALCTAVSVMAVLL